MTTLTINEYYDFNLIADSVLGSSYKNAKLVSIMDYDTAKKFSPIDYYQLQIAPYLPGTISRQILSYTFYLFKYKDKDLVIAKEWINDLEITSSNISSYVLSLTDVSDLTKTLLTKQLNILGINYTLTEA